MGKAGYLPDISGRFNQWTSVALKRLDAKDYHGAIGALNNMNALLDEEHRVSVSTDEYNEKIHAETFYQCNFCTESITSIINKGEDNEETITEQRPSEISYNDVHVFDRANNFIESTVINKKTSKVWECPKCHEINKLSQTDIIEMEREDPFYIKVIPAQPEKNINNIIGFNLRFKKYFNEYSKELENAMMNYRIDYIKEHGEDMADGFKDKGD